jgi:hypothetical protein
MKDQPAGAGRGRCQPHWVLRIVASFPERRAGLVVRGFSPTGCCAWRASFWRASGRVWEGRFSPTGCCASWRPFLRGVRGWWYGGLAPLGAAHGGPPSGERASMGGEVQPHWVLRIVASFPERRAGLVVRGFSPTGCCAFAVSFLKNVPPLRMAQGTSACRTNHVRNAQIYARRLGDWYQ